jgi:hypothetical protein
MPRWIPTWRFLALMCPAWAVLGAEGFRFFLERFPAWARTFLVMIVVVGAAASVVMWWSCGTVSSWSTKAPCRSQVPRYPFDDVVAWADENTGGAVVMTPATYWQTSLDVYAIFQKADRIREYVPPYGSPAPPLNTGEIIELCGAERIDFVVVPYRQRAGRWIPNFMETDEARRMSTEFGRGGAEVPVFTRGAQRLEVFPCPAD